MVRTEIKIDRNRMIRHGISVPDMKVGCCREMRETGSAQGREVKEGQAPREQRR
jgi:hypothetical protein